MITVHVGEVCIMCGRSSRQEPYYYIRDMSDADIRDRVTRWLHHQDMSGRRIHDADDRVHCVPVAARVWEHPEVRDEEIARFILEQG